MNVWRSCAVLALVLVTAGCDSESYRGKTTSEWLRLARDNDEDTRIDAIEALASMKSAAAQDAVKDAAKKDASNRVRLHALHGCAARLSDAELLDVLVGVAARADARGADALCMDPFIAGVDRLGRKAQPVAPDLRRVRDALKKQPPSPDDDEGSSVHVELLNEMIVKAAGNR